MSKGWMDSNKQIKLYEEILKEARKMSVKGVKTDRAPKEIVPTKSASTERELYREN